MLALEQNTQEWLDFRKDKIGASDMPIILGISPYCTPYELWRQKLGFSEGAKENDAMRRGKELEPFVRKMVNDQTEYTFSPEVCCHPNYSWAIASLDGVDTKQKTGLEVKCTSHSHHKMVEKGNCPDVFYPQIQWQMACRKLEQVLLAHYHAEDLVLCFVKRDDIYIEETLIPKAIEFYWCLTELIPPEAEERDYVYVHDPEFETLALEWLETSEKLKTLQQKEDQLKKKLIDLTDDGNCKGYGILLKKKKRSGSINWNRLWEDICKKYPVEEEFNPEEYRKDDIFYWDIRKEKKEE